VLGGSEAGILQPGHPVAIWSNVPVQTATIRLRGDSMRFDLQRDRPAGAARLTLRPAPDATARAKPRWTLRPDLGAQPRSAAMPAISRQAANRPGGRRRAAGDADDRRGRAACRRPKRRRFRSAIVAVRHDPRRRHRCRTRSRRRWKAAEAACPRGRLRAAGFHVARDDERAPAPPSSTPACRRRRSTPFLERLGGLGAIGRHATAAEDKTAEVVDVEARLKNMAEFRDNLRKLMATPGARLKDLIEVERELTRVQSELDSLATRRKVLANETEKVRVTVAFSARPAVLEAGMWLPVKSAVLRAGHVLARAWRR
jgi:hypothetical protein